MIGLIFLMIRKLCEYYFWFLGVKRKNRWWLCLILILFFACPCFVPDIHQAIERSTKSYEILPHVSENHVVKNSEVDYFKTKSLFLSVVFIIFWAVCIRIPKIVLITIGRFIFECVMKIVVLRLKSAINVKEEV